MRKSSRLRETMRGIPVAVFSLFICLLLVVSLHPLPAAAQGAEGRIIVELRGDSYALSIASHDIKGTDNVTRQKYKFMQERHGKDFHYTIDGLSRSSYIVEFSFVEPYHTSENRRVFSVYANGSFTPLPGLDNLDLYREAGKDHAYQVTVQVGTTASERGRKMDLRFKGEVGEAVISNLRLIHSGETAVEINALEVRQWQALPLRFVNGENQDVHEVILGRMGSRFMINPVPQLLAWRQSPLGTWTEDLSELVLAFRGPGGEIRCLPFTARYPVFEVIDQELSLTAVTYACEDPALPFRVTITLRAPFYPGDVKLSSAPFFYLEVKLDNHGTTEAAGDFLLVLPHKEDNAPLEFSDPSLSGYKYSARYCYGSQSSVVDPEYVEFQEGVAVDDASDITLHRDISSTSWIWPSPPSHPPPYRHKVFTFRPRGYSGLEWNFRLPPGGRESRTVILASYTDQPVLEVQGDPGYRFIYSKPAPGPGFSSLEEVISFALDQRDTIVEKSRYFDGVLREPNLSGLPESWYDLVSVAFQNFLCNTWWTYDGGGNEWFSVWEGTPCMFHSTLDVEYNDAWFYLCFWPELLRMLLREWPAFEKGNPQGKYLSHDMGIVDEVNGMAYPHDMPVEENADYILLLYAYWKTTGDTDFMQEAYPRAVEYAEFIMACDTDTDGMPDLHTANTVDQGSPAVQYSRNQTYLGIKASAAFAALREMALGQTSPDLSTAEECRRRIRLLNFTLQDESWLGDHFAVCLDPDVPSEEREAFSLYASNGLLYLLSGGSDPGLTASNLERTARDLAAADLANLRRYGYVHASVNNENQWVSQNLWRDAVALQLGVEGWSSAETDRLNRYWYLEEYYARKKNGGFWDVCDYRDGYFLGTSEAVGLGLDGRASARRYLEEARREGGGVRGAYALDSAFNQALGYYPRGTAALALVAALAGLGLDRPADTLSYAPSSPCTVPVLACADWDEPDPAGRLPLLSFNAEGDPVAVVNARLLPSRLEKRTTKAVTAERARPFSSSPGMERSGGPAAVTFRVPSGCSVEEAVVFSGLEEIKNLEPGTSSVSWDGTLETGEPAFDGVYGLLLQGENPADPDSVTPELVEIGVNTNLPSPSTRWYLAEGYTGSNPVGGEFDTWILVQNPNDVPALVRMTFMEPDGQNTTVDSVVQPRSRFTLHVDDVLPDAQVSTVVEADRPVVVERAVYFNGGRAGHAAVGVTRPSPRWYLAEGYTGGSFDEWILVLNPSDEEAAVRFSFLPQGGGEVELSRNIPPRSRFTLHVDDVLPDAQVSTVVEADRPVVVERAQYLNDMRSGTCNIAARSPSRTWYFAEGYTGGGFEEWLLLQNPWEEEVSVRLSFMTPEGENPILDCTVPARSRYSVAVHDLFPGMEISAKITAERPVVAERAMYWNDRSDGHAGSGTPCPEYGWYFAEGYTGGGFEEWLLLQNPWEEEVSVELHFLLPQGEGRSLSVVLSPRSRYTVDVGALLGPVEVGVEITADRPVVAERAMYFDQRSGGTCSSGALK